MFPRGSKDATTNVAPAPMSKKPSVALMAPPTTWPEDFRRAMRPMAVMMPMRNAGTAKISLTRNSAMLTSQSMGNLLSH